jgi:hypothetical protein
VFPLLMQLWCIHQGYTLKYMGPAIVGPAREVQYPVGLR